MKVHKEIDGVLVLKTTKPITAAVARRICEDFRIAFGDDTKIVVLPPDMSLEKISEDNVLTDLLELMKAQVENEMFDEMVETLKVFIAALKRYGIKEVNCAGFAKEDK